METKEALPFRLFSWQEIQRIWKNILAQRMYAVVGEKPANLMEGMGLEQQVNEHCERLREAGVTTFEVTARHPRWQSILLYVPGYMNRAVGTHANILTLYQAIVRSRVAVNVAAHAMNPLTKGRGFLSGVYQTDELRDLIEECSVYIRTHIPKFDNLGLDEDEMERLRREPLMMDPIDFAKAHNAILIPAGETTTEHYDIIQRGAQYGVKAFPWWKQTPKQWGEQFAALSDMLKKPMMVCATGKIGPDNVVETLETSYVITVGASSLIGKTPAETYEQSRRMVDLAATAKKST